MDIFSFEIYNNKLYFSVWELKKDQVNNDTLMQALAYYREIVSIIGTDFDSVHGEVLLIGKSFGYLPLIDCLDIPVKVLTYGYGADGITFTFEQTKRMSYPHHPPFSKALKDWHAQHPEVIENHSMKESRYEYVYTDENEVYETNE